MALKAKANTDRLEKLLALAPREMNRAFEAAATRAGSRFLAFHRKQRLSAKTSQATGPIQATRRGFIGRRRLKIRGGKIRAPDLNIFIASGPAAQHEEGRTLRARGGGFLPVPMPAAKDTKGRIKKVAIRLLKAHGRLILVKDSRGRRFLARVNRGKKGKERLTFFFHLQKQVKLKPRFQFFATFREFRPQLKEIFFGAIPFALRAVKRRAGG